MMTYANHGFTQDSDREFIDTHEEQASVRRKDYSRGRATRSQRRRSRRASSHPGPGIGGRRNRRFGW